MFNQSSNLQTHVKRIHTGDKSYKCDVCGKKYSISSDLQAHKLSHTYKEFKSHKCDVCHQSFYRLDTFRKHQHLHMDEKVSCDMCNKKCNTLTDLKKHYRIHTGEKPYKCDV